MSYDDFSSRDLPAIIKAEQKNSKNRRKFVLLWHALPTILTPDGGGFPSAENPNQVNLTKDARSTHSQDALVAPRLDLLTKPSVSSRVSHFDLMFEDDEHLITFEIATLPIPGERMGMRRLHDHRLHYLDYEGPLEPGLIGEDRGHVTRWAVGEYDFFRWTENKLIVELTSPKLSARIVLLPGKIEGGVLDTCSSLWPGVISWELRVPRWDVKRLNKTIVPVKNG